MNPSFGVASTAFPKLTQFTTISLSLNNRHFRHPNSEREIKLVDSEPVRNLHIWIDLPVSSGVNNPGLGHEVRAGYVLFRNGTASRIVHKPTEVKYPPSHSPGPV